MEQIFQLSDEIQTQLALFGLTRQEAVIYSALLTFGEMNGYEAAKKTGISRANAYTALRGITAKGAAWKLEQESLKYTPVPLNEFLENKMILMQKTSEQLLLSLPKIKPSEGAYITITGLLSIKEKIVSLIRNTEMRIYLSLSKYLLEEVLYELKTLMEKKKKVVIITNMEKNNLPDLKDAFIYTAPVKENQIRLISDSTYVLTGEIDKDNGCCLFSNHTNLVSLFKESITNEIRLIELDEEKRS